MNEGSTALSISFCHAARFVSDSVTPLMASDSLILPARTSPND
ncbi:hypothetical protein RL72_00946 [Microbacterium azadirachtae]|uniref:Uncharacterized protein n=1 Tax=Microbacterium azadirachtae TaxID=582680 RepID=A0A0F0L1P9_9MICO|nr:hypothetical protein RL72_00946 [Microbacterium azadirachtae]